MLNPFPQLLVYGFFAPTILRIAAACVFFMLARQHMKYRKEAAHEISVVSHQTATWGMGVYIAIEFLVALGLLLGFWTQIAALVGLVISLKALFFKRSLHHLLPLSRTTYVLLAIICFSLLLTGAGAIAFDLPL